MTTTFTPQHLSLWTHPKNYVGATWEDYYVFLGVNRDSDALTRANFDAALKAIGGTTGEDDDGISMVTRVEENHWLVGWVAWIAIHKSNHAALAIADEIIARLESYPVVDEELWGEYESQEANEVWQNCYDPKERVAYIRKHRSQFEFQDYKDMMAVIRGAYFTGYASELIH